MLNPKFLAEIEPSAKATEIAAIIRDQIVLGALGSGLLLHQDELTTDLGASRPSVREALNLLEREGVVTHEHRRGFFVSRISSAEARQLFRLRALVEAELLASLRWPDEPCLQKLETNVQSLRRLVADGSLLWWIRSDQEFERTLSALSSEETLTKEADRLRSLTDRYRSVVLTRALAEALTEQKSDVLAALQSRDRPALLAACERGREQFCARVIEALAANDR